MTVRMIDAGWDTKPRILWAQYETLGGVAMLVTVSKIVFAVFWLGEYFVRFFRVRKVAATRGHLRERMGDYRRARMEWLPLTLDTVGRHLIPILYLVTSWLCFADRRQSWWALVLGAAVFLSGLWLLYRSRKDPGTNWTPAMEILPGQQLVTSGVFLYIRHPMYAAHWLWSLAQAFILPNWLVGLSGLALFLPLNVVRVPREEKMMRERFGEEYRVYMANTARFIPRLWRAREKTAPMSKE